MNGNDQPTEISTEFNDEAMNEQTKESAPSMDVEQPDAEKISTTSERNRAVQSSFETNKVKNSKKMFLLLEFFRPFFTGSFKLAKEIILAVERTLLV